MNTVIVFIRSVGSILKFIFSIIIITPFVIFSVQSIRGSRILNRGKDVIATVVDFSHRYDCGWDLTCELPSGELVTLDVIAYDSEAHFVGETVRLKVYDGKYLLCKNVKGDR